MNEFKYQTFQVVVKVSMSYDTFLANEVFSGTKVVTCQISCDIFLN